MGRLEDGKALQPQRIRCEWSDKRKTNFTVIV